MILAGSNDGTIRFSFVNFNKLNVHIHQVTYPLRRRPHQSICFPASSESTVRLEWMPLLKIKVTDDFHGLYPDIYFLVIRQCSG